jgi:hypothetical protein
LALLLFRLWTFKIWFGIPPPSPLDLSSLVSYFAPHLPLNLSGLVWYSFFFASRPLRFGLVFLLFRHWAYSTGPFKFGSALLLLRPCPYRFGSALLICRPWIFQFWLSISVIFASGPLRFDLVSLLLRQLPLVFGLAFLLFLYCTPKVYSTGPFKFGLTFLLCTLRTFLDWFGISIWFGSKYLSLLDLADATWHSVRLWTYEEYY